MRVIEQERPWRGCRPVEERMTLLQQENRRAIASCVWGQCKAYVDCPELMPHPTYIEVSRRTGLSLSKIEEAFQGKGNSRIVVADDEGGFWEIWGICSEEKGIKKAQKIGGKRRARDGAGAGRRTTQEVARLIALEKRRFRVNRCFLSD